jgi:hypothetical protein
VTHPIVLSANRVQPKKKPTPLAWTMIMAAPSSPPTSMMTYPATRSADPAYSRAGARAMWASSLGLGRAAWSTRLGFEWVSTDAPLGSWPVAGPNLSWAIPLRAEPIPHGGLPRGQMAGREIIHAGLAGDRPIHRFGPLILAAGTFFVDVRVTAAVRRLARESILSGRRCGYSHRGRRSRVGSDPDRSGEEVAAGPALRPDRGRAPKLATPSAWIPPNQVRQALPGKRTGAPRTRPGMPGQTRPVPF